MKTLLEQLKGSLNVAWYEVFEKALNELDWFKKSKAKDILEHFRLVEAHETQESLVPEKLKECKASWLQKLGSCDFLVMVDGLYRPDLSSLLNLTEQDGVILPAYSGKTEDTDLIESVMEARARSGSLSVLNIPWNLNQDVSAISLPPSSVNETPLILIHVHTVSGFKPAPLYIRLGEHASLTCIEQTLDVREKQEPKTLFLNRSDFILLHKGSRLRHFIARSPRLRGYHYRSARRDVHVHEKASYEYQALDFGSLWGRDELIVALKGEGAQAHFSGASHLSFGDWCERLIQVQHEAPNTTMHQNFRSWLSNDAYAIYATRADVDKGMSGVSTHQKDHLILNDKARAYVKPFLSIEHDELTATHAVAISSLNQESLHYLLKRGLGKEEAQNLLKEAFLSTSLQVNPFKKDNPLFGFLTEWLSYEKK